MTTSLVHWTTPLAASANVALKTWRRTMLARDSRRANRPRAQQTERDGETRSSRERHAEKDIQ